MRHSAAAAKSAPTEDPEGFTGSSLAPAAVSSELLELAEIVSSVADELPSRPIADLFEVSAEEYGTEPPSPAELVAVLQNFPALLERFQREIHGETRQPPTPVPAAPTTSAGALERGSRPASSQHRPLPLQEFQRIRDVDFDGRAVASPTFEEVVHAYRVEAHSPRRPLAEIEQEYIAQIKGYLSEQAAERLLPLLDGVKEVLPSSRGSIADKLGIDFAVVMSDGRTEYLDVKWSDHAKEVSEVKRQAHDGITFGNRGPFQQSTLAVVDPYKPFEALEHLAASLKTHVRDQVSSVIDEKVKPLLERQAVLPHEALKKAPELYDVLKAMNLLQPAQGVTNHASFRIELPHQPDWYQDGRPPTGARSRS